MSGPGAAARVLEIERSLGDPWDAANTTSLIRLAEDGHDADADAGLGFDSHPDLDLDADFVPTSVGGRLDRLDHLGRVARHVLGRDADLALSGGMSSLPASASLWVSGTHDQQLRASNTLLRHRGIHFVGLDADGRAAVRTDRVGTTIRVRGNAELLDTAPLAELVVVHAVDAKDDRDGSSASSLLLLDQTGAGGDVPPDALIGEWGRACRIEGRRQALSTSVAASALVGLGDTALRLGVRAVGAPDGGDGPASRWLGDCFADLLVADAVATVACRSVHLLPSQCVVLAAAARWQTAQLIGEILYRVALHDPVVPAATAAPMAKLVRDFTTMTHPLPTADPAHLVIGRRLADLAATPVADEPPDAFGLLYDLAADLPGLGPARPGADPRGDAAWLSPAAGDDAALHAASTYRAVLHEQFRLLAAEGRAQRAAAGRGVTSTANGGADGDHLIEPARRCMLLLAATSCVRVWSAGGSTGSATGTAVSDEAWLLVALDRILHRLGLTGPEVPDDVRARLTIEALGRISDPHSLDLYADRMR